MKALFLDRDGIFNEGIPRDGVMTSPRNWNEVRHYPGLEGLAAIKQLGYLLVMVTNQPDIERRIITKEFATEVHEYYREKYGLDAIYMCPFSSNDHPCKKPNPGMFLQAARDLGINLGDSYHLGDTDRDIGAARYSGCRSILWERPYNTKLRADFRVKSLDEVRDILRRTPERRGFSAPGLCLS